ncbi:beta-1,3-glucanase family protein [Streptomyces mirabilis]|uniref:beta-1,3-glucanase family protein n=1 Tax=Streptomyces mirabilis TaxID=68239 RepID=UPI0036945282
MPSPRARRLFRFTRPAERGAVVAAPGGIKNDYAAFLHTVGLDRRAYAFPYDDINDQSSVQILGNANPPTGLTLGIGW